MLLTYPSPLGSSPLAGSHLPPLPANQRISAPQVASSPLLGSQLWGWAESAKPLGVEACNQPKGLGAERSKVGAQREEWVEMGGRMQGRTTAQDVDWESGKGRWSGRSPGREHMPLTWGK